MPTSPRGISSATKKLQPERPPDAGKRERKGEVSRWRLPEVAGSGFGRHELEQPSSRAMIRYLVAFTWLVSADAPEASVVVPRVGP